MANTFDDRSKWPVDGGKSFAGDWEGAGAGQMQQGGGETEKQLGAQRIEVTGGNEAAVEIPIVHVQPQANGQPLKGDTSWDNWVPHDDLG